MALTDADESGDVTIKVEEDQEVSEVKGCYIWLSESDQPNLYDETGLKKPDSRVKRRRCSVAGCYNFLYKNNTSSVKQSITFHKFPKNERTRAIWVKRCNRAEPFSANSSYICSDHFIPEDYAKTSIFEHPLEKRNHRLRPGAVPCLKLPQITSAWKSKNYNKQIIQDQEISYHEEKENGSDLIMLQGSFKNEDEKMGSSQEEDKASDFATLHSSDRNKKDPNKHSLTSSDVVTISSSEDEDIDQVRPKQVTCKPGKKRKALNSLRLEYDHLLSSFEKLKTETNEEIERLNSVIKNKEDEFSRELKEVLSVFLKPEEVQSIIEQTEW